MHIVLLCRDEKGSVAFSAEQVEGLPAPERRYAIVDQTVTLSGYDDVILHHDADVLLANPLYRMPTAAEQDGLAEEARAASSVQEAEKKKTKAESNGG